jgi:hypothetical protein
MYTIDTTHVLDCMGNSRLHPKHTLSVQEHQISFKKGGGGGVKWLFWHTGRGGGGVGEGKLTYSSHTISLEGGANIQQGRREGVIATPPLTN